MRITFILNSIGLSGGTKVVFEYANRLHQRGHEVSIVYPLIPLQANYKYYNIVGWFKILKSFIRNLIRGKKFICFDLKARLLRVPTLSQRYIPDSDIVVATWWSTAFNVAGYDKSKGEKFYLVQHYEIWGGPKEKVDLSYKLGLKMVSVSNWIKNTIENELDVKFEAVIQNAPGCDQFYPENRNQNNTLRILTSYRKEDWKGFPDAAEAFRKAKDICPEIKLVAFGPCTNGDLPEDVECHQNPVGDKLRAIYNSCDIFLFPSHCEGFGLPPMEAMACKCAVVTTNVGAIPDYTVAGETALISEPGDIDGLSQHIITLVKDRDKRSKISENGYNYIRKFNWEDSCDKLECLFEKSLTNSKPKLKGN